MLANSFARRIFNFKGGKKLDDARTSYNTIFFAGVVTVSFRSETISVQDQVSSRWGRGPQGLRDEPGIPLVTDPGHRCPPHPEAGWFCPAKFFDLRRLCRRSTFIDQEKKRRDLGTPPRDQWTNTRPMSSSRTFDRLTRQPSSVRTKNHALFKKTGKSLISGGSSGGQTGDFLMSGRKPVNFLSFWGGKFCRFPARPRKVENLSFFCVSGNVKICKKSEKKWKFRVFKSCQKKRSSCREGRPRNFAFLSRRIKCKKWKKCAVLTLRQLISLW